MSTYIYAEQYIYKNWENIDKLELPDTLEVQWFLLHEKFQYFNGKNITFYYLNINDIKILATELLLDPRPIRVKLIQEVLTMFENIDSDTNKRIIYF